MQQQRVVRALHLQEMAACLDAEAATWRLLWQLYGVGTQSYPGSLGGPKLPGCPGASTVAQHIAATLEQDAELNRCDMIPLMLIRCIGESLKILDMRGLTLLRSVYGRLCCLLMFGFARRLAIDYARAR